VRDDLLVSPKGRVALSLSVVVPSLLGAAYLALDWADYGGDSTCGNFIRRKNWSGACSGIMWHRTYAVIGLSVFAVAVVLFALLWGKTGSRRRRSA
jgi:hypothetical protein